MRTAKLADDRKTQFLGGIILIITKRQKIDPLMITPSLLSNHVGVCSFVGLFSAFSKMFTIVQSLIVSWALAGAFFEQLD